jgi:hypothetical protein
MTYQLTCRLVLGIYPVLVIVPLVVVCFGSFKARGGRAADLSDGAVPPPRIQLAVRDQLGGPVQRGDDRRRGARAAGARLPTPRSGTRIAMRSAAARTPALLAGLRVCGPPIGWYCGT